MSDKKMENMIDVRQGDCLNILREMPDCSVDAIVTDPPYGLSNTKPAQVADVLAAWVTGDDNVVPEGRGFMGAAWDGFVPPPAVWKECIRVLKPGGHMAVFAGARTQDLMGLSIRLAGFEIRDTLGWVYGSGFPKSMNVGKAIDATVLTGKSGSRSIREATDSREVIGTKMGLPGTSAGQKPGTYFSEAMEAEDGKDLGIRAERLGGSVVEGGHRRDLNITAPASDEAKQWDGWGTALKPAIEPIILARKSLDGTVAANVLAHGVGGLNIDASRVGEFVNTTPSGVDRYNQNYAAMDGSNRARIEGTASAAVGRFPANVLLDEHAAKEMDKQSGVLKSRGNKSESKSTYIDGGATAFPSGRDFPFSHDDSGGASRFFPVFKYQAKAPKKERPIIEREDGTKVQHPTVKPVALMEWLVELITPPGGVVLDPFAGSGTTLEAARNKGFSAIGIEREVDYVQLIHKRLENTSEEA